VLGEGLAVLRRRQAKLPADDPYLSLDGGRAMDYAKISPAGALQWRGYATVHAIQILRPNDRL
jgi:hypothetical protein